MNMSQRSRRKGIDWEAQIGRRLRLRDLYAFFTVVRHGSMAKAAAQLGVSQPAISKLMADLEYALGVRLLDRNRRGVEPTTYGEALLRRGLVAFDELKQGVRDIEFLADAAQGEIRIECLDAIASTFLPQLIERFSKQYPRVSLHVDTIMSSTAGLPGLRERKYDLVLQPLPRPLPEEFRAEDLKIDSLHADSLIIAAGRHNPWTRRRKIDLAELVQEPWIMQGPETWNYRRLREAFQARGLELPKSNLVTLSTPLRVHFLANGPYISAIARSLALQHSLVQLAVDLPTWEFPISIVTLKNRTLTPVVERFIESARSAARAFAEPQSLRSPSGSAPFRR
jgi:DNA-binding transcriptional LysR family regulator